MSEERKPPHVLVAINEVKMKLAAHGGIVKGRAAPKEIGGYAFRGIDDADNALCGLTAEHGLVLSPKTQDYKTETQIDPKGRTQRHVTLVLAVEVLSSVDGSAIFVQTVGEAIDTGDKAFGKAFSNARKLAVFGLFQIPTHGENVEEYATQIHPPQASASAGANGAAPPASSPAISPPLADRTAEESASTPAPRPGPKRTKAKTAAEAIPDPGQPISDVEAAFARIGEVNTFPLLHSFTTDALQAPEPGRSELVRAIVGRAAVLFSSAQSWNEAKEGLPICRLLGDPESLKEAANRAYARFRNQPSA